jgi:hypothetical protein
MMDDPSPGHPEALAPGARDDVLRHSCIAMSGDGPTDACAHVGFAVVQPFVETHTGRGMHGDLGT